MSPVVGECCEKLVQNLKDTSKDFKEPVDFKQLSSYRDSENVQLYFRESRFFTKLDLLRVTVYRENFAPVLISPLLPEGEFKTGLIELYIKDYIKKLESGRIQGWANLSQISIG